MYVFLHHCYVMDYLTCKEVFLVFYIFAYSSSEILGSLAYVSRKQRIFIFIYLLKCLEPKLHFFSVSICLVSETYSILLQVILYLQY
jgi:hypothetical protein